MGKIIFLFGFARGWQTFFVLKSFDNDMVNSVGTNIEIRKGIFADQKSDGF